MDHLGPLGPNQVILGPIVAFGASLAQRARMENLTIKCLDMIFLTGL